MPGELHWGPFTLQWSMLSWIAAILAGYGLMYWRLRSHPNRELNNELLALISNAIFIFIIVWKFGAVLSDFSLIWRRPLGLLLYTGGLQETYYGLVAAGVVILYGLRKMRLSIRVFADLLPWGVLGSLIFYQISNLRINQFNVPLCIVAIGVLLGLLLVKPFVLGAGVVAQRFSISFGLGLLLLTLFAEVSTQSFLTVQQIWFVSLVLFGLFITPILKFIDNSFLAHPNERKERDEMDDPKEQENGA
ncbi:MAG: hypothetical protein WD469_07505 [Paenibacillaceae bacterium]